MSVEASLPAGRRMSQKVRALFSRALVKNALSVFSIVSFLKNPRPYGL